MTVHRWGLGINGAAIELDDLAETHLPPGGEPWVEWVAREQSRDLVLRSAAFDTAQDAVEADGLGRRLLASVNAMLRLDGGGPFTPGAVFEFVPDGPPRRIFLASGHSEEGRCISRGVGVVIGPDGSVVEAPPPVPTRTQRMLDAASADPMAADVLHHLSLADDWYEIYKCLEVMGAMQDSARKKLALQSGIPADEIENLRQTANYYRHYKAHKPATLMPLRDAKRLLSGIAGPWLSARTKIP
jgi:hypothetical protein